MSFSYFRTGKTIYLESVFPEIPKKAFYEIISGRNYQSNQTAKGRKINLGTI